MDLTSNTVQELSFKGEVPENYIYKGGNGGAQNAPVKDIPVIDVGLLGTSPEELEKLKSALSTWGCFQV